MPVSSPTSPPVDGRAEPAANINLVSPLLPTILTLIVAATLLAIVFAWLFPGARGSAPPARFAEISAASGINFKRQTGLDASQPPPTTLGGGVIFFDYNQDGRPDLLLINGAAWPWEASLAKSARGNWPALYRNDGNGHFTEVTAQAGLNVELQGMTAAVGDYDNDGYPDIFITCVGQNHLFRNRGNGTFEDVTDLAGVGGDENTWSTGATWIDFDNDGKLDLVVCHYVRWPHDMELSTAFGVAAMGRTYGTPTGFFGVSPSLYRNLGDGHFALVTGSAGLRILDPQTNQPQSKALSVIPVDANGDGKLDLWFSFQGGESALFLNQGNGSFRRQVAPSANRPEGFSASIATSQDIPFVEANSLDQRLAALRAAAGYEHLDENSSYSLLNGKGAAVLLDYDNDGRLDLFATNARAEPDTGHSDFADKFASPPSLYWNSGDNWVPAPATTADGVAFPSLAARGVAVANVNGDGELVVALTTASGRAWLWRNAKPSHAPWLDVDLVASHSQHEAGGARVEVRTPRHTWYRTMAPAMGYMAQSESTLHFGLGDDARVRRVIVLWPSGVRQEIVAPAINQRLVVTEPP